ncbi:MAG: DUF6088 family protein [Phycisphaerae bacterium]|nr:DUF6088 family protein [Phycisphaerae bacterium]
METTLQEKIEHRIRGKSEGWVFTRKDFLDLGANGPIGVALARLVKAAKIRRFERGIYYLPAYSNLLQKEVSPDSNQIAEALARKFHWAIIPHGATAANMLGLSQQVPAQIIYLSDGPNRTYNIGNRTFTFQHVDPKDIRYKHQITGLVINGLQYMGQQYIEPWMIKQLRTTIPSNEKRRLLNDARYCTNWVYEVIQRIAADCEKIK